MNLYTRAFSLIELMVVIAIVAVLAAIAVPAYKNYVIKAKTSQIVKVLEGLSQRSIAYSQKHGVFPNAYQLGLSDTPTAPESNLVTNPSELLPASYFDGPNTDIGTSDSSPNGIHCGASAYIGIQVNPYALGIPGSVQNGSGFNVMVFFSQMYNINGVIHTFNTYYTYIESQPNADDYVTGWQNYFVDSSGTQNQQVADTMDYISANAECQ